MFKFKTKEQETELTKKGTLSDSSNGKSQTPSECESIKTKVGSSSDFLNNAQLQNEFQIRRKTMIQPPSKMVYEWKWDIPKFDRHFHMIPKGALGPVANAGKIRILKSDKITAGGDMGLKSQWYFKLSESIGTGILNWNVVLKKIHTSDTKTIHVAFTFKIVGSGGRELQKKRCFRDFQKGSEFGWGDVIDLDTLYAQKSIFLEDNTLRTQVLFEIYAFPQQSQNEALKQERSDFANLMTTDMRRLRTATGTADIHVECGGKVFPAHKLILAARSGAFARMFDVPMALPKQNNSQTTICNSSTAGGDISSEREQSVSSISIPEVEPDILEIVLDYIYSGNVKPLDNHLILTGVVRAADKFDLPDLKAFCFNALMKFAADENIGDLAVLAHRHNAEKNVKSSINNYCKSNVGSLMKRKGFKDAIKEEPDAFFTDDE